MSNKVVDDLGLVDQSLVGGRMSGLFASTGAARIIGPVARRELTTRVRTKSFLISNAIILVLILGGVIAASVFADDPVTKPKLGLVGSSASLSGALAAGSAAIGTPWIPRRCRTRPPLGPR